MRKDGGISIESQKVHSNEKQKYLASYYMREISMDSES